jgi:ABC-2 type transport system ATP-binding protein
MIHIVVNVGDVMIEVKDLTKEFKMPIRKEGVFGMFKTLFSRKYETKVAVNLINFTIHDGEILGYIGQPYVVL